MSGIILTLWHKTNEIATLKRDAALLKSLERWKSGNEHTVDILLLRLLAIIILMIKRKMSDMSMFHDTKSLAAVQVQSKNVKRSTLDSIKYI